VINAGVKGQTWDDGPQQDSPERLALDGPLTFIIDTRVLAQFFECALGCCVHGLIGDKGQGLSLGLAKVFM
jgi:hypothetical protein